MPMAVIDNAATSGDLELVTAVPGKKILVTSYTIVVTAAVGFQWKSGSTPISGPMNFSAGGQGCAPPPRTEEETWTGLRGLIETARGEALILNVSGDVQVGGHLTYEIVRVDT
jgi:hypothetical protein